MSLQCKTEQQVQQLNSKRVARHLSDIHTCLVVSRSRTVTVSSFTVS